jgi:hypothetical protein
VKEQENYTQKNKKLEKEKESERGGILKKWRRRGEVRKKENFF